MNTVLAPFLARRPRRAWLFFLGGSLLLGGCDDPPEFCSVDYDQDGAYASIPWEQCPEDAVQLEATDCDDLDFAIYPGAYEYADGRDNDCDGLIDEGQVNTDDDGDGYSEEEGDCDDSDPAIYPGANDIPLDEVDSNCDGYDSGTRDDLIEPESEEGGDPSYASAIYFGDTGTANKMVWAGSVGDLDGDGLEELACTVSTVEGSLERSEVMLVYGIPGGGSGQESYEEAAELVFSGIDTPNLFGEQVVSGDLNGDGLNDLVIGDPFHFKVYIYFGSVDRKLGGLNADQADVTLMALVEGAFPIGDALAIPGDLDGDGFDDLVIGQSYFEDGRGRTALFYGRESWSAQLDMAEADAMIYGEASGNFTGADVSGPGDLDGDGYPDLAIFSKWKPVVCEDETECAYGWLSFFYGGERYAGDLSLEAAAGHWTVDEETFAARTLLLEAGDLDGDGLVDLAVGIKAWLYLWGGGDAFIHYGQPDPDVAERALRFSGETSLTSLVDTQLLPRSDNDDWSWSLAVGDLTGDGLDDVAIASKMNVEFLWDNGYPDTGYVAVFGGTEQRPGTRTAGDDQGPFIEGAYGSMERILSISAMGDLTQDGLPELVVGAEYSRSDIPHSLVLSFEGGMLP